MAKKISVILSLILLTSLSAFAQTKVDLVALRSGITQGTVTVGTDATAIPTTALSGRRSIIVVNISSNNVFLGASDVATSDGYQLYPKQSISIDLADNVTLYGIASSSSEVRYLEVR